jgi:hypothetical protein
MTKHRELWKRLMVALSYVSAVALLLSACSATGLNTLLKLDANRPTFVFFWESG